MKLNLIYDELVPKNIRYSHSYECVTNKDIYNINAIGNNNIIAKNMNHWAWIENQGTPVANMR